MKSKHPVRLASWLVLATAVCLGPAAALADTSLLKHFDIGNQALASALSEFARQSDRQILFSTEVVESRHTAGIKGELRPEEALEMLLQGTGLSFRVTDDDTILVEAPAAESAAPIASSNAMQLARVDGGALGRQSDRAGDALQRNAESERRGRIDGKAQEAPEIEEIVVTGTHIRGIRYSASPVLQFDRQDLERSGFATAEQFLHSLPQNFGGGGTVMTGAGAIRGGEGYDENFAQGTGINLRGMGNDATLVLLNGRRLAAAGVGKFVDLSLIPLGAVERIEVLTDGASAIYGSDAVGGVVNLITRKEYDGAETRLRYGTVVDGSHDEQQLGQMFGRQWDSGSALLSYDYFERSPLGSEDRYPDASQDPSDFFGELDILPPEERHGVLASVTQTVSEGVDLYADALYSQRDTRSDYILLARQVWDSHVEQYGATLGATISLASTWQADVTATSSRANTDLERGFGSNPIAVTSAELGVTSFDAKADGTVFRLPAGPVRMAVGAHYRRESFENSRAPADLSRNVRAVFGELQIPLIGSADGNGEGQRLELTLAGRHERYSDFGSTTDPKYGVRWSPVPGFSLRGTYGTSFRAPIFNEMDESLVVPVSFVFPDSSSPSGFTTTILIQGNASDLGPQEAENWTVGVDFAPASLEGLELSLTYFGIDFDNRVSLPIPVVDIFGGDFLNNPSYASVIVRNPDIAAVDTWFAHPNFINQVNASPGDIGVVVDDRRDNVARRREKGIDFSLSYAWDSSIGAFNAQVAGTYLLELEDQVVPGASFVAPLNTVSYPVDLRMRNSLSWHRDGFGASAFLNYVDSYEDVRAASSGHVSSWTTVDLTLDYDMAGRFGDGWLANFIVSLSAQNLFDRDAPFVVSLTGNGINFDPTNALPLGRFVALQVRKAW